MNPDTGLSSDELSQIAAILKAFPEIDKAYLFGSRAKGSYKPGSDVDLAVSGVSVAATDLRKVSYRLNEETTMPYFFDIVHLESISSEALLQHIREFGLEIFHC